MPTTENPVIIIATFFVALILTILPMPDWTIWLRPAWVLLVLIYWSMNLPFQVNIGTAWVVGIVLDILTGTLLGQHALALTIVTYVVVRIHARLPMFPMLQQGLIIFTLVLSYQFILYCIQGFIGQLPHGWLYWSSSVISLLLWPWVYSILRGCRKRSKMMA